LFKSTKAILFLGTPHRGSEFAQWGDIFRGIVHAIGFDAAHQNLRDLRPDSAILDVIRGDFQKLHSKAQQENGAGGDGGLKVYTFKEAKGITGIGFVNLNNKVSNISRCQLPSP